MFQVLPASRAEATPAYGPCGSLQAMLACTSPLLVRVAVLVAAFALGTATTGADLVELVTCGAEKSAECGPAHGTGGENENGCDHCPSCMVAHGHMQSVVAGLNNQAPTPKTSGLTSVSRQLRSRLSAQDIFHPPITPSV